MYINADYSSAGDVVTWNPCWIFCTARQSPNCIWERPSRSWRKLNAFSSLSFSASTCQIDMERWRYSFISERVLDSSIREIEICLRFSQHQRFKKQFIIPTILLTSVPVKNWSSPSASSMVDSLHGYHLINSTFFHYIIMVQLCEVDSSSSHLRSPSSNYMFFDAFST